MNMADSRPRPVPKPRARQKSLPASTADLMECFSSSFSPPTSNKPPITKPKPPGYKTLDYSNKGLVSITAEIDIGDEPGSWKPAPSGKKQMEDNNNLENSKNLSRQKDQESLSKDAKSCEQPQTASALCKSYTKPLPPLPAEAWSPKPQLRHSLNLETFSKELKEKKCDIASSTRTPPLPRKPPRLYLSDDSVNAQSRSSVEKPSVAAKKPGAIAVNGTHNPPLPRKPTVLRRRSTGTASSEVKSNTAAPQETMVDSEDQAKKETNIKTMHSTFEKSRSLRETRSGSVGNKNSIRTQLSSALQSKNSGDLDTELPGNSSLSLKQTQSEDSIIANHCHPQPSFDKPSKVHLSSSDGQFVPSGVEFGDKSSCSANVGCTPSLPKKTGRRLSPALEKHLQTVKNRDDSVQTNDRQPSLPSHTTTNQQDASGNCSNSNQDNQRSGTSGSRSTNISSPSSQIKRKPPESKSKNANQLSENVVNPQKGATRVPVEPGAKNASSKESEVERNKQGRSGKSASNAKQKPPQTSPPDLPSLPSLSPEPNHAKHTPLLSPPRRLPSDPPTQLSVQEGKRKSEAPPPPKAPRPKSVLRDNALKKKKSSRSQSMGNLFEDSSEDPEYWVAYQHLRQLSPSQCDEAFDSDDGEYESPDKNVLRGFIASMERKHGPLNLKHDETKDGYEAPDQEVVGFMKSVKKPKDNQNKSEPGVAMEETEHSKKTTTYSSSSDDSDHEYEEPDSPKVERKESEKDRGVLSSSSRSSSDRSGNYVETICPDETEKRKNGSENSTKKYEFKPFKDMSGEWTKPKEINWEYNGSSDDSDGSYVEPDADDDDEEFELGDEEEEEPLYQIYQANVLEKERTLSLKRRKKSSVSECLPTSPGIGTLRFSTLRGGKMLWSQLPEVRNGEVLENMSAEQRKLQEAIFEVVSSEASYLKSLNLLLDHFLTSKLFTYDAPDSVLNEVQVSELFSNIKEIVKVSESFLNDLRTRQRQSVIIDSISDIITDHATNHFKAYVTYCSTQYKQDRMLSSLKKTNCKFAEALENLERDRRVFGLTLQSFLVLPMQRVTRYPLLVDAIVRRCEPGHSEYYRTDEALKAVNKVVYMCNEGARNEERHEEMLQIEKVVAFFKMKPIQLVTTDRWLARRGPLQLLEFDRKSTLSSTLRGKFRKYRVKTICLFLFSDLLVVTKKKSDVVYSVIDFASRNMIRVQEANSNAKNSFILVLLENFEKKTKELHMRVDNETELTRWKEAFEPPKAETDDEKIYGSWDCPQVHALHNYQAQQSDELSLVPGDVVNVLRKLPDGWYEGERIRDGMCGWFPANHTEEIRNEHVRARNLHQRYRLLAASTAFLDKRKR